MCFLLGNDFLPHLLALDLRYSGLDVIMETYVNVLMHLNQTIISDGHINKTFLLDFLYRLSLKEDDLVTFLFEKRLSLNKHFKIRGDSEEEKQKQLELNKPILEMDEEKKIIIDTPHCMDWRKRYYFHTGNENIDVMCENYIEGLNWTAEYYFSGVKNWRWQYNYNHGPLLKDLVNWYKKNECNNVNITNKPVSQTVQLMSIFPSRSKELIDNKYRKLMTSIDSPIFYMYPLDYKIDTLFKRYSWMCQPILPMINIDDIELSLGLNQFKS